MRERERKKEIEMDLFLWFQTGVKMMMKMKTVADSKMMMSAMMWQEPKFMQRVVPTSEYILTKFAIFKSDSYKFCFKCCGPSPKPFSSIFGLFNQKEFSNQ